MTKDENENITMEAALELPISLPKSELGLAKHNNSHYFMCPLFDVKGVLKYKEYVNSYIDDGGRKSTLDSPLYCLFKFNEEDEKAIDNVNQYFYSLPKYAFSYFAGTNNGENLIMYALKAKDEDKQDYKHIINGRYSMTSTNYKLKYKSFGFVHSTLTFIDSICNKEVKFKKQMEDFLNVELEEKSELWNIFEPHREVFRYI